MMKTFLAVTVATTILLPLWAVADDSVHSCNTARMEENVAQKRLQAFGNQKAQLQKQVTELYQELLLCQDIRLLSTNQREYCQRLKREARQKVEELINVTTSVHHGSKTLGRKQTQKHYFCRIGSNL